MFYNSLMTEVYFLFYLKQFLTNFTANFTSK